MKLKTRFKHIVDEYTKEFYKLIWDEPFDKDNVYWIGEDRSGVCNIGDYYVGLSDMVFVVDNQIKSDDFFDWYWTFVADEKEEYINLRSYAMNKGYKIK
ncbi:MAG: hypothetical protein ACO3UU_14975 [Minisyncoccia bacterium]